MELGKEIGPLLSTSFTSWFSNKKLKLYFLINAVLLVILGLTVTLSMGSIFKGLTGVSNPAQLFPALIGFYTSMFLVLAPISLIIVLIDYLIISECLKIYKRKSQKIDIIRYIKLVFFPLVTGITAALSLFNIRWLLIGIAGLVIFIIGIVAAIFSPIVGGVLAIIGAIIMVAYYIIVIYNMVRLSMGCIAYVEGRGVFDALRQSWKITKRNVWNIIIAFFVFVIIAWIIAIVSEIPAIIYAFVSTISTAISTGNANGLAGLNLFSDPVYIILLMITYIVSAYIAIATSLFAVGIYNSLAKK